MELRYNGSGKVYFNDEEYSCDLYLNNKLGGIYLRINVKDKNGLSDFYEVPLEIDYLCGELNTGFKFTLINLARDKVNHLISYGKTEYTYTADYILYGVEKREDNLEQKFKRVSYTITNILEWGEESAFKISEDFGLFSKKDSVEKVLYKTIDYEIKYIVRGSLLPIIDWELFKDDIQIQQKGIIEIKFNTEQKLTFFNGLFDKVKKLIETSMISNINIESVSAFSDDLKDNWGNAQMNRQIKIYGKNIKEMKKDEDERLKPIKFLTCNELLSHNSFEKYFSKQEKLEPIFELFLEPLYINGSSNSKTFLNVVQALETYHSRFITNNIGHFKKRVEQLAQGPTEAIMKQRKKYFMASSKSFITLESRIADLLKANWQIHFDTGEISDDDFPSVISQTRHYYIHFDESIKLKYRILSNEELPIYTRALLKLLDYYILLELGYSANGKETIEKINNRWGNISQDLQILRLSQQEK